MCVEFYREARHAHETRSMNARKRRLRGDSAGRMGDGGEKVSSRKYGGWERSDVTFRIFSWIIVLNIVRDI